MKRLTCEMCGSTDLIKQNGVFVCQHCETKYSVEEAKKMMIEGTVDVSGSTVKLDTSEELENLYILARRAKDDDNCENAVNYYGMILLKAPTSWEASFYLEYFKARKCKKFEISEACSSVESCLDNVMSMIKDNVQEKHMQFECVKEITEKCIDLTDLLEDFARRAYSSTDEVSEMQWLCFKTAKIMLTLGDSIEAAFGSHKSFSECTVRAWENGIEKCRYAPIKNKKEAIEEYSAKIQRYDDTYIAPGACYIATAVYGSYDCPQVWTLRRFRDDTLAKTQGGRCFIRLYYATAPTLIRLFGKNTGFVAVCRSILDRMVKRLNKKGVENTPYIDK